MSGRLNEAADAWRQRLAHLPRPCTAVLIGGDSGAFVFSGEKGQRLGQLVNSMALHDGGSLLVTDSARTPGSAFEAFQRELSVPAYIHHWTEAGDDNPYLAYLALADQLVVTGESMSPTLADGEFVMVRRVKRSDRRWAVGDIIVFRHPLHRAVKLVKRVTEIHPGGLFVEGDNPDSVGSSEFGIVDFDRVEGIVIGRIHPLTRSGRV